MARPCRVQSGFSCSSLCATTSQCAILFTLFKACLCSHSVGSQAGSRVSWHSSSCRIKVQVCQWCSRQGSPLPAPPPPPDGHTAHPPTQPLGVVMAPPCGRSQDFPYPKPLTPHMFPNVDNPSAPSLIFTGALFALSAELQESLPILPHSHLILEPGRGRVSAACWTEGGAVVQHLEPS